MLLVTRLGHAGSSEEKERAARMACLSGDSAKGVAILTELFIDTKDSTYIFNQARCFEQGLRYAEAIARFQEYLRVAKKASKSEKADAEKHIVDCEGLLAKQQALAVATPPPAPAPVLTRQPAAPVPVVAASPPVVQQVNPQPAGSSGSGLRTAGVITVAVGGVALVAGVVLNLKVNSMASDLQKTDGYTSNKESDRKTYETLGWVSYGVGAACVATGAVLYYLGQRPGSAGSSSVALVPAFAPGQAGAILKGAF